MKYPQKTSQLFPKKADGDILPWQFRNPSSRWLTNPRAHEPSGIRPILRHSTTATVRLQQLRLSELHGRCCQLFKCPSRAASPHPAVRRHTASDHSYGRVPGPRFSTHARPPRDLRLAWLRPSRSVQSMELDRPQLRGA